MDAVNHRYLAQSLVDASSIAVKLVLILEAGCPPFAIVFVEVLGTCDRIGICRKRTACDAATLSPIRGNVMNNGISLLVFSWLLGFAVFGYLQLSKGAIRCAYGLFMIHFVLCGLPLLLDVLFGMPQYRGQPGLSLASSDSNTFYVYCLYVSFVPLLWTFTAISSSQCKDRAGADLSRVPRGFGHFGTLTNSAILILPIILVIASPKPELYLTYGMIATTILPDNIINHHSLISASVLVGLLSIAGILLNTKKLNVPIVGSCVLLTGVYIWVNGKRHIVFASLLVYLYVGLVRGALRGRSLVISCLALGLIMGSYSEWYQTYIRKDIIAIGDPDEKYTNKRIDYGRDAVIKFTIYCELKGESMKILDYRGQSVLFNVLFFVPRKWMPEKPWPYAQYLTASIYFTRTVGSLGYSMTTSWLEEAIANFGWAGVVLGPLVLSGVCRLADFTTSRSTQGLGILVASLLLAVHLAAFIVLALLWIGILLKEGCSQRKGSIRCA